MLHTILNVVDTVLLLIIAAAEVGRIIYARRHEELAKRQEQHRLDSQVI